MTPEVAIVVSPRDWAERLHRFVADHGGARVRARVLDAREAVDERYQVLVAEDLTSFLTPRLVGELHRSGRRVLGVYDRAEPWGRERLGEIGVDEALPTDTGPEVLLRSIEALALTAHTDLDAELRALHGAPPTPPPRARRERPAAGRVTAVSGPPGGVGRSEVALGLATAYAATGDRTALVDGDDVAPALAQRLGLALHPNLRTAVDVAEHRSGRLADCLQPVARAGVEVLVGLRAGRDASGLRPAEAVDVVRDLARTHQQVVVDVGCRLEELGGLGSAPGRYALGRTLVAAADTIVAVAAPTPVGLARLLEWLADLRALTAAPIAVAFNRVPAGTFQRGELEQELGRTFRPGPLAFLPEDRRVRTAAWAGEPVGRGPFTRALARFATEIIPAPVGATT